MTKNTEELIQKIVKDENLVKEILKCENFDELYAILKGEQKNLTKEELEDFMKKSNEISIKELEFVAGGISNVGKKAYLLRFQH